MKTQDLISLTTIETLTFTQLRQILRQAYIELAETPPHTKEAQLLNAIIRMVEFRLTQIKQAPKSPQPRPRF